MKLVSKLFLCFVVLLSSCGGSEEVKTDDKLLVNVATVATTVVDGQKEFAFIAKPFISSELSFRVGGPIDRFEVYAGNYYKQGSIIAEIDPRDFRIRKERAEGVYNQSKAEFTRIESLYEKNNISASAYEKSKSEYTTAKTAFQTATNELEDTKLLAPFSGYVGEVFIEKYQDVKATQKIISFEQLDQLKIEVYVTQEIAFRSQDLKTINLFFDADRSKIYTAKVVEISKSTTKNNISYLLTALLDNNDGKLLAGMSGKVFFDADNSNSVVVTVPQNAIWHRPSVGDFAWVVENDKVYRKEVTLGGLHGKSKVVVTSGLEVGQTIATSSLRFLSEGLEVQINNK